MALLCLYIYECSFVLCQEIVKICSGSEYVCIVKHSAIPNFFSWQIIASVGLDKKLYTYDSGSRRPSSCIPYEAPFSSLAFRDDGWTLAAGTSNGRVVFYDVRGKPQPFVVLHAYGSSEVHFLSSFIVSSFLVFTSCHVLAIFSV